MDVLDRWSVNESLLQSYRSTFISSQSILLVVGAIFSGKSSSLVYLSAVVSLVIIWFIWFPVVSARHRLVDYYKYSGALNVADLPLLCSEHDYVHSPELRAKANDLFKIKTNWRKTRLKLDIGVPLLFSIVWLALVVHELCGA